MKIWLHSIFIFILLITLVGCGSYRAPVMPPTAYLSNFQAPVDVNFNDTVIGPNVGESGTTAILGLFSFGDASVYAAARQGNITRIDHIEYAYTNILGIVTFYKTKVYGE